jgi:hypothetical protein
MIEWLDKIAGNSSGGVNAEREEYINLKKEVKRFRKKVYNCSNFTSTKMKIEKISPRQMKKILERKTRTKSTFKFSPVKIKPQIKYNVHLSPPKSMASLT